MLFFISPFDFIAVQVLYMTVQSLHRDLENTFYVQFYISLFFLSFLFFTLCKLSPSCRCCLKKKEVFFSEMMHFFCWMFSILHTCYHYFVSAVGFLSTPFVIFKLCASVLFSLFCSLKETINLCIAAVHHASLTMLLAPPTGEKIFSSTVESSQRFFLKVEAGNEHTMSRSEKVEKNIYIYIFINKNLQ